MTVGRERLYQFKREIIDTILKLKLFPNGKIILIFAMEVELLGLPKYIKFHSAVNFQFCVFNRKPNHAASCN